VNVGRFEFDLKVGKSPVTVPAFVKTGISVGAHVTGLSRVIAARYRGRGNFHRQRTCSSAVTKHKYRARFDSQAKTSGTTNRRRTSRYQRAGQTEPRVAETTSCAAGKEASTDGYHSATSNSAARNSQIKTNRNRFLH